MNTENSTDEIVLDLYLRTGATSLWSRQQEVIDRVENLDEKGKIDRYRIQEWSGQVSRTGPLSETVFHQSAIDKVREFEQWAKGQGESISLPFEKREVDSTITGEHFETVCLPAVCVAIYTDGELIAVAPYARDEVRMTVDKTLTTIEAGEFPTALLSPQ